MKRVMKDEKRNVQNLHIAKGCVGAFGNRQGILDNSDGGICMVNRYGGKRMKSEWQKVRLGDVCDITSSKRIFAKEYQTFGVPFYRGKEIIEKQRGNSISTELFIGTKNTMKFQIGLACQ